MNHVRSSDRMETVEALYNIYICIIYTYIYIYIYIYIINIYYTYMQYTSEHK